MSIAIAETTAVPTGIETDTPTHRVHAYASDPTVLADIYKEEVNIAVWQRSLSASLEDDVDTMVATKPWFKTAMSLAPDTAQAALLETSNGNMPVSLAKDIAELVNMFCCLLDLERAGLRLATIGSAMCPRFHVDRVPCRLITTYHGLATEWLPHDAVNRAKLGRGSNGQPDAESGLYSHDNDIQRLSRGDVALIKGALWDGNAEASLVHRSPVVPTGKHRVLLTLDASD